MSTRLSVTVTPRADRDAITSASSSAGTTALAVRVRAAPSEGRANAAVVDLVAAALGVPRSRVSVVRGLASRHKVLVVQAPPGEVQAALARLEVPS